MKKRTSILLAVLFLLSMAGFSQTEKNKPVEIKVLILPKFEIGEMAGDFPGEAQYYYEAYCSGADEYEIRGGYPGSKLYVKDGAALYVTGMGKVNAAASLSAVLLDDRFDFSSAYLLSTGCAGSSSDYSVMGDLFVISATADYDLGHHLDPREYLADEDGTTWVHDPSYDDASFRLLNQDLVQKVYDLICDTEMTTTEKTRQVMQKTFPDREWAGRDPMVLRGTGLSSDNYWKGWHDHANAVRIAETYGAPDPYATTEMEDMAIALTADRMGMLDRLIVLRVSVDLDTFTCGATPESAWSSEGSGVEDDNSVEYADIFAYAMENNFRAGRKIVDAILDGTF